MSEKYERVGLRAIAEDKLALVLLAGGQGRWLGVAEDERMGVVRDFNNYQ